MRVLGYGASKATLSAQTAPLFSYVLLDIQVQYSISRTFQSNCGTQMKQSSPRGEVSYDTESHFKLLTEVMIILTEECKLSYKWI